MADDKGTVMVEMRGQAAFGAGRIMMLGRRKSREISLVQKGGES